MICLPGSKISNANDQDIIHKYQVSNLDHSNNIDAFDISLKLEKVLGLSNLGRRVIKVEYNKPDT